MTDRSLGARPIAGMKPANAPSWSRLVVVAAPYLWLASFFLVPFLIVFKISLSVPELAMPPYSPQFTAQHGWQGVNDFLSALTFDNYRRLYEDPLYVASYLSSVRIAAISTFIILLIGYPIAYAMARAPKSWQPVLMIGIALPFFSSLLIRIYAWIGILKPEGLLNHFLAWVGLIDMAHPIDIFNSETAVIIGIVYSYLPFMILPLYATLEKMDISLLEAARDLGCTPTGTFWRITFPLSIPGVVAGCLLVFIPAIGEYVIPDLLGGSDALMIGKQLVNEFYVNRDWPAASAVAVVLLLILAVPIAWYQKSLERRLAAP